MSKFLFHFTKLKIFEKEEEEVLTALASYVRSYYNSHKTCHIVCEKTTILKMFYEDMTIIHRLT